MLAQLLAETYYVKKKLIKNEKVKKASWIPVFVRKLVSYCKDSVEIPK